jgi:hypothetical protein
LDLAEQHAELTGGQVALKPRSGVLRLQGVLGDRATLIASRSKLLQAHADEGWTVSRPVLRVPLALFSVAILLWNIGSIGLSIWLPGALTLRSGVTPMQMGRLSAIPLGSAMIIMQILTFAELHRQPAGRRGDRHRLRWPWAHGWRVQPGSQHAGNDHGSANCGRRIRVLRAAGAVVDPARPAVRAGIERHRGHDQCRRFRGIVRQPLRVSDPAVVAGCCPKLCRRVQVAPGR